MSTDPPGYFTDYELLSLACLTLYALLLSLLTLKSLPLSRGNVCYETGRKKGQEDPQGTPHLDTVGSRAAPLLYDA